MEKILSEDYCSFELSKLLKEKGFDGECIGCYWNSKKTFDINYEPLSYSDGDLRDEVILAPTHQMAMKWLRKKGIYINIIYTGEVYHYFVVNIFDSNNEVWYKNSIEESTYEEAVEAALFYTLENLI